MRVENSLTLMSALMLIVLASVAAQSIATQEPAESVGNFDDLFANVSALTDAQLAAYASRASHFAKIGARFRPDVDFRTALSAAIANEVPQWSQGFEELVIRDFFQDKRDGFFVDVGCYFPDRLSTTYYLEKNLHWSGIAVDAQRHFAPLWKEKRPRSTFIASAISNTDHDTLTLFIAGSTASLEKSDMEIFTPDLEEVQVKTITLNTLLDMHVVTAIDFLSIDIDGAEPGALEGFDIQRFRPRLVGVEAGRPAFVKQYFETKGYELIEKYTKVDKINFYFQPKSTRKP